MLILNSQILTICLSCVIISMTILVGLFRAYYINLSLIEKLAQSDLKIKELNRMNNLLSERVTLISQDINTSQDILSQINFQTYICVSVSCLIVISLTLFISINDKTSININENILSLRELLNNQQETTKELLAKNISDYTKITDTIVIEKILSFIKNLSSTP